MPRGRERAPRSAAERGPAPWSHVPLARVHAAERGSILFARNLFLPDDLGGNRYPYETPRIKELIELLHVWRDFPTERLEGDV